MEFSQWKVRSQKRRICYFYFELFSNSTELLVNLTKLVNMLANRKYKKIVSIRFRDQNWCQSCRKLQTLFLLFFKALVGKIRYFEFVTIFFIKIQWNTLDYNFDVNWRQIDIPVIKKILLILMSQILDSLWKLLLQ